MTSDSSLIERQMADVELRPFTIDEFHRRRRQKERNRRIGTAVMGLVLAAVVAGGVLGTLGSDDQKVDSEFLGPLPSPFEGTWESTDGDGSFQTMEIRRIDGDEHEIVLHDDSAGPCSGAPSTETGSGWVRSVTELVVAVELTCDDGSTLTGRPLDDLTFTHDPETDELTDSTGVVWQRPGPEAPSEEGGPVLEGPSPFEGSWVASGVGEISPESMEITHAADGDVHEVVVRNNSAPQCAGGATTLTATGRRETDGSLHPGLVQLVLSATLTCDDGSTPVPASPEEEGMLDDFPLTLVHDPVTDEVVGSLGVLWWREGTERKQGDPMATVERMIDAVNAGDTDAFIDLFAPDGGFDSRGSFDDSAMFVDDSQPISEEPLVQAWMAIQDAWGFEAELGTCTSDPSDAPTVGKAGDRWVECRVAARWPKLSLEITDRWRFELRGARLLYWEPAPLDLDPSERALPLGYPGLEAWEAWLEANHAEDAGRWLVPREEPPAAEFQGAEDPEREEALARLTSHTPRGWVIQGHRFSPAGLIPYDPAFADDIEASIHEYLEEQ